MGGLEAHLEVMTSMIQMLPDYPHSLGKGACTVPKQNYLGLHFGSVTTART